MPVAPSPSTPARMTPLRFLFRGRLAMALGKHKSFVSQIANPAYAVPIPAGDLPIIFEICHLSAQERQGFLEVLATPDGPSAVPPVLLSGHHADIARWRRERSLELTACRRPDLIAQARAAGRLTAADERFLAGLAVDGTTTL